MTEWKTYKNEVYCFWSQVPLELKPKLGDENGQPIENKSVDHQGYHYVVKRVPPQNGKQAWYKVVKTPINGTNPDYSEGARKGHEENIAMHKEHIEIMRETNTNLKNLNETMLALLEELRKQKE